MKCDNLTAYKGDVTIPVYGTIADAEVYLKKDVDAAIAELKEFAEDACIERDDNQTAIDELQAENAELKQKLEDVNELIKTARKMLEDAKATAYAESVDAGMRERRLKRALWLARAERANEIHFMWCQLIYDKKYGIVKFNVRKEWYKNIKQGQTLHTPQGWADVWDEVEYRCRAKAEEYK